MARAADARLLAALLLALASSPSRANTFEIFGFGPRGESMASALTAEADDYTAVFYNPAMLVLRKDLNFGFSFSWHHLAAEVVETDRSKQFADHTCDYCHPADAVGYTTGLLFPLAGKVKNRLALGFGAHVPSGRFLRALASDPNRPAWYLFNSSPERFVLYAGAGLRLAENLTAGVGVHALADLVGQGAKVEVDLFSKRVKLREIDAHLSNRAGPLAGLFWAPIPSLRFGATFRWELALYYRIPATVDLEGIGTLELTVDGVTHFSPHTLAAGMAWDVTPDLTFSLDGQWMNWAAAPSPYLNLTIDLSGNTLQAIGLDKALDITSPTTPPGFSNTLGGRLGMEYRIGERFAARGGVFYRPTPVPRQDAPETNVLDASAVGLTAGMGFSFDDPLEVFAHPVKIDLAGQHTFLLPREAKKEPTDPVPPYRYSARVYGLTAAIRYDF
ncbi:MAG: outer membrane protein transport protein [Myxococcales bacterium]|nr:outer membrane protein transport protein [Myxococcales bacterium]